MVQARYPCMEYYPAQTDKAGLGKVKARLQDVRGKSATCGGDSTCDG